MAKQATLTDKISVVWTKPRVCGKRRSRAPSSDAPGVQAQVVRVGDGGGVGGGGPDHGGVVRAQLRRWDDEPDAELRALLLQGVAQQDVCRNPPGDHEYRSLLEVGGAQELASERLDDSRLVACGQVRQLFAGSLPAQIL